MDIKQRVAARREELARQARADAEREEEGAATVRAAALDHLSAERASASPLPQDLNVPAPVRRAELARLLKREVRKVWTGTERAGAIGCFICGLIAFGQSWLLAIMLIVAGGAIGYSSGERHRKEIVAKHPDLFAEVSDLNWFDLVRMR